MPKKTDANQAAIVRTLRQAGASVQPIHMVGSGTPDLLVGYRGLNFVLEVKDGSKPPSARRLTPDEREWHDAWRGQVWIVETEDEALRAVGAV